MTSTPSLSSPSLMLPPDDDGLGTPLILIDDNDADNTGAIDGIDTGAAMIVAVTDAIAEAAAVATAGETTTSAAGHSSSSSDEWCDGDGDERSMIDCR